MIREHALQLLGPRGWQLLLLLLPDGRQPYCSVSFAIFLSDLYIPLWGVIRTGVGQGWSLVKPPNGKSPATLTAEQKPSPLANIPNGLHPSMPRDGGREIGRVGLGYISNRRVNVRIRPCLSCSGMEFCVRTVSFI